MRFVALILGLLFLPNGSRAAALEVVSVAENVWALVGELGQRSPDNLGNNATFGAVLTSEGFVLIDAGATVKGAMAIERALRSVSDRSVVAVINTGGQDHRWLANSHWKASGARVIAAEPAVADQRDRSDMQWSGLTALVGGSGMAGTVPEFATEVFRDSLDLVIGGVRFEIRHPGRAHTPGDTFVWLPAQRVMFAGDIVFMDRMLGILPAPVSNAGDWIKAFDAMAAMAPGIVVPGHGWPNSLSQATAQTRDYLLHLRDNVQKLVKAGGTMTEAARIDQSAFAKLAGADQLGGRNAQAVFQELEFDE